MLKQYTHKIKKILKHYGHLKKILTNQFNEIDAIYNDFLIGGIQRLYESIDLIIEGIEIHQIDDNKALLDNTRAQTSKIVPTTLITA